MEHIPDLIMKINEKSNIYLFMAMQANMPLLKRAR